MGLDLGHYAKGMTVSKAIIRWYFSAIQGDMKEMVESQQERFQEIKDVVKKLSAVDWDQLGINVSVIEANVELLSKRPCCEVQTEQRNGGTSVAGSLVDRTNVIVQNWNQVFEGKHELSDLLDSCFALTVMQSGTISVGSACHRLHV